MIITEILKLLETEDFPKIVKIETTNDGAEAIKNILNKISNLGSSGHSFGIISDDGDKVDLGGWDGDGDCRIGKIEILEVKNEKS